MSLFLRVTSLESGDNVRVFNAAVLNSLFPHLQVGLSLL